MTGISETYRGRGSNVFDIQQILAYFRTKKLSEIIMIHSSTHLLTFSLMTCFELLALPSFSLFTVWNNNLGYLQVTHADVFTK